MRIVSLLPGATEMVAALGQFIIDEGSSTPPPPPSLREACQHCHPDMDSGSAMAQLARWSYARHIAQTRRADSGASTRTPREEITMLFRRRPPIAMLVALSVLAVGTLGAAEEEDGKGAETWSSTNNQRCVRTTHRCVKWSADNTPTDEVSYECGNLYFFHTTVKVLTTCAS